MIRRRMKPYSLFVGKEIIDDYGHGEKMFTYVGEVMAVLGFLSVNQRIDDIRYQDCQYTGLTPYKGFDIKKEYKLIPKEQEKTEYHIKSINQVARLTQLLLQEVLF